jgi:hypothetical protein
LTRKSGKKRFKIKGLRNPYLSRVDSFFGIQGSQFSEATWRESSQRKPHEFAPAKGGDVAKLNSLGSVELQFAIL